MPAFTLTALHSANAESNLIPDGDFGGVSRFASLIAAMRDDAANISDGVLILSAGNTFLSSPQYKASLDKGDLPHYDALAMDIIGFDASGIGHHEFDFGADALADFVESFASDTPFLSANLDVTAEPRLASLYHSGRIAPSAVFDIGSERVGVIGVTTPDISFIANPGEVVASADTLSAVRSQVDALVSQGVNKILLISHLQSIEQDMELISGLSQVDAVISGSGWGILANEDDTLIPGDEGSVIGPYPLFARDSVGVSVPIVTTLGGYGYVGRLSLTFDGSGRVLWVDDISGVSRVAGGGNPDAVPLHPEIESEVIEPVREYIAGLSNERVGKIEVPLDSQYPDMRNSETNEGNLIADALLWQARQSQPDIINSAPSVAVFNGGGIGIFSIPANGILTELDIFSILRFPDLIVIARELSPADFKDALENAFSRVEDNSGRFPHITGFTVVYDPNAEARVADEDDNLVSPGSRVVEITLADGTAIVRDGAVVESAPAVNLVTIRFLASGGDQYPLGHLRIAPLEAFTNDALSSYIRDALGGAITAQDYPERGEGRITRR